MYAQRSLTFAVSKPVLACDGRMVSALMPRGEIYVQLVVNYDEDPKVRALAKFGREARACRDLYVQMVCYCKRNLTDGFVPAEELGILVYPDSARIGQRDAGRLAEVGLVAVTDGGYQVLGYLKRNKSKAEVDAVSAVRADAGHHGGVRSGEVRRGEASAKQVASGKLKQTPSKPEPKPKQVASQAEAGCFSLLEPIGHRSETEIQQPPAAAANGSRPSVTQRSKLITDAYAAAEPMCKWPAVNGVVIKAIKSERYSDNEIRDALLRMAAENRSVTVDSLRTELAGMTPRDREGRQPYRNPTDQSKYDTEEIRPSS